MSMYGKNIKNRSKIVRKFKNIKREMPEQGFKNRIIHTDAQVEKALWKCGGFISMAAKMLAMNHTSLCGRIANNPHLQQVKNDIMDARLDVCESKLQSLVRKKNLGAICFSLKCLGKKRGFIEGDKEEESGRTHVININFKLKEKDIE